MSTLGERRLLDSNRKWNRRDEVGTRTYPKRFVRRTGQFRRDSKRSLRTTDSARVKEGVAAGVATSLEVRAQLTPSVGARVTRNRTRSAAVRRQLRHPRTTGAKSLTTHGWINRLSVETKRKSKPGGCFVGIDPVLGQVSSESSEISVAVAVAVMVTVVVVVVVHESA